MRSGAFSPAPARLGAAFAALALAALLLGGCSRHSGAALAHADRKGPAVRALLEGIMPKAMADGIVKIALLANEKDGINTWQFIEAAVAEGRAMGFTVDAFAMDAEADREGFMRLAAGIAGADYDGVIFVNGALGMGYAYDALRPIADAGARIVAFEALPVRDGRVIPGLVAAFQNDYGLARLSLEALVSHFGGQGRGGAPRVFRIAGEAGIAFLDRHEWEFSEFARMGKIEEAGSVRLRGLEGPRAAAWEAISAALPHIPPGSVDALWVPWSEFAIGAAEALFHAGRSDIKVFSTGISNESLRIMQRHRGIWIASTAADHKLAGAVTMRMLAALLAGEVLDEAFFFRPQLVMTADLNRAVNAANLSMMLPSWEDGAGLFDGFGWMAELRAAESRFLRISPAPPSQAAPLAAPQAAPPAARRPAGGRQR